jgi:transposase
VSMGEHRKWGVIQRVIGGKTTGSRAAEILELSRRQVWRLVKRGRVEGLKGMVHRGRGRRSNRRLDEKQREQIVRLYAGRYEGFNLTHFREMLVEREQLRPPCRETLRRILSEEQVWERRRKAPKHRQRRVRREQEGDLLQMDASLHRWLGEDKPLIALIGAIDDATNDVPHAQFFEAETTEGYMTIFGQILQKRGVPLAVYTDYDSVFFMNNARKREEATARGQKVLTQFGRALDELGVKWIPASSPQAKGRIERLWGTFQDRLLNEMRLEGIRTLSHANAYLSKRFLPRFNRQFRRQAADPERAYRAGPLRLQREAALCLKETRLLSRDYTFPYEGTVWQVLKTPGVLALCGRRIEVRKTLRGEMQAWIQGRRLGLTRAPLQPPYATRRAPDGALASLQAAEARYPKTGRFRL